jgi:hypothetical protein
LKFAQLKRFFLAPLVLVIVGLVVPPRALPACLCCAQNASHEEVSEQTGCCSGLAVVAGVFAAKHADCNSKSPSDEDPGRSHGCPRNCASPCCLGLTIYCVARSVDSEFLKLDDRGFAVDGGGLFPPNVVVDGPLHPPRS